MYLVNGLTGLPGGRFGLSRGPGPPAPQYDYGMQSSFLDTTFNYIFNLGLPGKTSILKSPRPSTYRLAQPADM